MTYPVHDPNSDKYPDRVFWSGLWCTQEQIAARKSYNRSERGRARYKRNNAKRIRVMGEQVRMSSMEVREFARLLRDERKESHG